MSDHVILLHGLWMRAFTLVALRHHLERAGHSVELFDYDSVLRGPEVGVQRLLHRVSAVKSGYVHFVGHSLGGLIALQALQREPALTRGRVVCLGSPLLGSAVARGIARLPGGRWSSARAWRCCADGIERWEGRQQVGAVAGRLPFGSRFRRRRTALSARRHGRHCRNAVAGPRRSLRRAGDAYGPAVLGRSRGTDDRIPPERALRPRSPGVTASAVRGRLRASD